MNRYFYILLLAAFISVKAQGQAILEARHPVLLNFDGSYRIGDTLQFSYYLFNMGDTSYTDSVRTYLATNLDSSGHFQKQAVTVPAGGKDSVKVIASFPVQPPHFQPKVKSIIVIWPTGTGTTIRTDSIFKYHADIDYPLTIEEQKKSLNYVRFYPNPARDILRFEMLDPKIKMQKIIVRDLQGKVLDYNNGMLENSISLEKIKPGLYVLEINFSDKKTAYYKIIKSR